MPPNPPLSTQSDSPVPVKWLHLPVPSDLELCSHAEWVEREGTDRLPDSCFYCWHLKEREGDSREAGR
jgi:hypothetical protein